MVEHKRSGLSAIVFRTFSSLQNPVYRLYYASMAGHWSSMNMQTFARALLIYRLTGSGAILGLSSLAAAIPMLVFSLPAGATLSARVRYQIESNWDYAYLVYSTDGGATWELVYPDTIRSEAGGLATSRSRSSWM